LRFLSTPPSPPGPLMAFWGTFSVTSHTPKHSTPVTPLCPPFFRTHHSEFFALRGRARPTFFTNVHPQMRLFPSSPDLFFFSSPFRPGPCFARLPYFVTLPSPFPSPKFYLCWMCQFPAFFILVVVPCNPPLLGNNVSAHDFYSFKPLPPVLFPPSFSPHQGVPSFFFGRVGFYQEYCETFESTSLDFFPSFLFPSLVHIFFIFQRGPTNLTSPAPP